MEPISIYFFLLASIIGLENSTRVSKKATFTINPTKKTFEVHQEDLFSIIMTVEDSLIVAQEIQHIAEFDKSKEKTSSDGLMLIKLYSARTTSS